MAIATDRQIHAQLLIGRTDGVTWEDLTDYLTRVDVELGSIESVGTQGSGGDATIRMMTFSLHNAGYIEQAYDDTTARDEAANIATNINLLTANQSDVETGTTGFIANVPGTTLSKDVGEYWHGAASLKSICDGTNDAQGFYTNPTTVVTASTSHTFSVWLKGSGTVKLSLNELTALGASVGNTISSVITLTSTWTRYSVTRAFGVTGERARVSVYTASAQVATFYADGLQLEQSSSASDWMLGGGSENYVIGDESDPMSTWIDLLFNTTSYPVRSSFAPRDHNSSWNQFGGIYAPLLWPGREVKLRLDTTVMGIEPTETDWHTVFHGVLGNSIQTTPFGVTCSCQDLSKYLVDTYIETVRSYGSETGVLAENVISQIMIDNRSADAPLLVVEDESVINLLTYNQSDVETDTTGFNKNMSTETMTRDIVEYWHGAASLKLVTPGGTTSQGFYTTAIATAISQSHTASVWLKGSGTVSLGIQEMTAGSASVGYTWSSVITLSATWTRYSVTRTFGATGAQARLFCITNVDQAITFYADGLMLYQGTDTSTDWTPGGAELLTPSFETDTNGDGLADNWTRAGSGLSSRVIDPVWDRTYSQKLVVGAGETSSIYQSVTAVPAYGYMFRCALKVLSLESSATVTVNLKFYDSTPTLLDTQTITLSAVDTAMKQRAVYGVAPTDTATVRTVVECVGGGSFVLDAAELRTATLSDFGVKTYNLEYKTTYDATQEVATQYGGFLGYRWYVPQGSYATSGMYYTLLEPDREKDATTADYDLSYTTDFYTQDLELSDADIRNVVALTYRNKSTGVRTTITVTDATSIAEYGRRAMAIDEPDASLIDTSGEGTTMATAALTDLKDLTATTRVEMPLFPEMDVFDGFTLTYPMLSSSTDFFAVESMRHSLDFSSSPMRFRTEVIASGHVTGAHIKWLRMENRPGSRTNDQPTTVVILAAPSSAPSVLAGIKQIAVSWSQGGDSLINGYTLQRRQANAEYNDSNQQYEVPASPTWGDWEDLTGGQVFGTSLVDSTVAINQVYQYKLAYVSISGQTGLYSDASAAVVPKQTEEADLADTVIARLSDTPIRQTVLGGVVDANGNADFLDIGTGLAIDLTCFSYSADLCAGGSAISGGDHASYPASNAVDDSDATYWLSSQAGLSISGVAYVGYDAGVGNTMHIRRVTIKQADTNHVHGIPPAVTIHYVKPITSSIAQYSTDGSTWINIQTLIMATDTTLQIFELPVNSDVRYFRLLANANLPNGADIPSVIRYYWGVTEISLYEATGNPLVVSFANSFNSGGAVNFLAYIDESIDSAWSGLTASSTLYLYLDRDVTTGTITYGFSELAPVYQYTEPGAPANDQHWFDIPTMKMKVYNSGTSVWDEKQRIFVGECVTHADHVDSVTSYALQGYQEITSAALAANQIQTLSHILGRRPFRVQTSLLCATAEQGYSVDDEIFDLPNFVESPYIRCWGVTANATNITTLTDATEIWIPHKTTAGLFVGITWADWKFRIRLWAAPY